MSLAELRSVAYDYDRGTPSVRRAIDGVSLTLRAGESVALLGRSGSGKSTLAQILAGVLSPSEGELVYGVPGSSGDARRMAPARLLFQFPEIQLFAQTTLDDVAFGPRNAGASDAEARRLACAALDLCRVPEAHFARAPWSLSDGERRRVALAGILALEPTLVLLDEPEIGLDRAGRERLEEIMISLGERGTAVVVATHDAELAARRAKRAIVLEAGRIAYDGATGALLAEPERLAAAGIAPPGTARLLAELARLGWSVRPGRTTPREAHDEVMAALRRPAAPAAGA